MPAANQEGVIKFQIDFLEAASPPGSLLLELNAWRHIFKQLGLLGQDPQRYDGYGYGNLSRRLPQQGDAFVISGTQTGELSFLQPQHYATVGDCDPYRNYVSASGQIKPSSEALSHGILYQCRRDICWVMHLHSPEIFDRRASLNLPCTNPTAAYGTPEMAAAIRQIAEADCDSDAGLLVMAGHEDGILAYGRTAAASGTLVVKTLALALGQG